MQYRRSGGSTRLIEQRREQVEITVGTAGEVPRVAPAAIAAGGVMLTWVVQAGLRVGLQAGLRSERERQQQDHLPHRRP